MFNSYDFLKLHALYGKILFILVLKVSLFTFENP